MALFIVAGQLFTHILGQSAHEGQSDLTVGRNIACPIYLSGFFFLWNAFELMASEPLLNLSFIPPSVKTTAKKMYFVSTCVGINNWKTFLINSPIFDSLLRLKNKS